MRYSMRIQSNNAGILEGAIFFKDGTTGGYVDFVPTIETLANYIRDVEKVAQRNPDIDYGDAADIVLRRLYTSLSASQPSNEDY